jgi:hypothetical protein
MKKLLLLAICALMLPVGAALAQYVRVAPPPPVYERPVPSPGPGYVFIPGYHRWDGHAYVWTSGRYVVPPRPHAVWIAGHWDHRPGGWFWVAGHWRS